MSLYQKHRPKDLNDVVGNKELIESIKGLLSDPAECPHAFLFHGPTGCGKTTIARIMAKELGCEKNDVIEIDTAQFRGIDTIRDLTKQSRYKTLGSENRTYIVDEVHGATREAQNALLKLLEDTPAHIYIILCTTDPQKLLPTIRGRCSQHQVKTLSDGDMSTLLKSVVKANKDDKLDKEILDAIINSADGHPRNAITILENVLATPKKRRLKAARVVSEEKKEIIDLCRCLASADWGKVSKVLKGLKGQDPEGIRRMVLSYSTSVLLNKEDDRYGLILEEFTAPTYDSGFAQIVYACYSVVKG